MNRPPAFRIVTDEDRGSAEIRLAGELDLATAPELVGEFERIGALPGLRRAVLDLRDLAFLDSTGLEAIVELDAAARKGGFDLAVVRGPRAVERLFAVMQLVRTLRIVDDPAELSPGA